MSAAAEEIEGYQEKKNEKRGAALAHTYLRRVVCDVDFQWRRRSALPLRGDLRRFTSHVIPILRSANNRAFEPVYAILPPLLSLCSIAFSLSM